MPAEIISRQDAIAIGQTWYCTGIPCLKGHIAKRSVASRGCVKCSSARALIRYHKHNEEKRRKRRAEYALNPQRRAKNVANAKQWHAANRNRVREHKKAYWEKNKDKWRVYDIQRKARKSSAIGQCSTEDIARLYKAQKGKCAYCHERVGKKYHVDHIMPLALGGTNCPSNLQLTCGPCNLKKGMKHPGIFARENGLLL